MKLKFEDIERAALALSAISTRAATSCAWLQACDYPGISMLLEAASDELKTLELEQDALGLNLHNVSCAFIGEQVLATTLATGRLFLRNVRHGLFLVPLSVEANIAIGCPVDAAFALGGPREKNPYTDKLRAARRDGIEIDDALWRAFQQAGKQS